MTNFSTVELLQSCPWGEIILPEWSERGRELQNEPHHIIDAWTNQRSRELLVTFIRNGILSDTPSAAEAVLCRMALHTRLQSNDEVLMADVRSYLDEAFLSKEKADSFTNDERRRIERRVLQLQSFLTTEGHYNSLLDIGCGDGKIAAGLGTKLGIAPHRVYGVDVFDRAVTTEQFEYRSMKASKTIPLPTGSIDLGIMLMTLHHEKNPEALLRDVLRTMADGGTLVIRDHDASNLEDKLFCHAIDTIYYGIFNDLKEIPVPGNYRSKKDWEHLFIKVGFKIERSWAPEPDNPMKPFFCVLKKVT